MLTTIFLLAVALFILAYIKYGKFLKKHFELDNNNHPPSHHMYDGIDYVPAPAPVLFGHHFSSIAGAGPVLRNQEEKMGSQINGVRIILSKNKWGQNYFI